MSLITHLKERQGDRSQAEFAAELKVNQSSLSRIYSGDRGVGREVGKKIARRFPDLAFEVASFLLADDMTPEQIKRTA